MQIRTRESASPERVVAEGTARSIRRLVTEALGEEEFVAGFYRRTEGTPCHPETRQERYDTTSDLPAEPRDDEAVWEELVVYSGSRVYRWDGSGFDGEPTRLPRSPDEMQLRG